ncbi:MAG: kinesin, partial [Myxococcales bacterium]|nr:kinesin [Myxococcales bacterium]
MEPDSTPRARRANLLRLVTWALLMFTAAPQPVWAQQSPAETRQLYERGRQLHKEGRYDEAQRLQEKALANMEAEPQTYRPQQVAAVLNELARLHHNQGRPNQAEPYYTRAIALFEEARGKNHPDVATALNNLAYLYREQGRYPQAEPLFKRALAIQEQLLGPSHPSTAITLNNLAMMYREQGHFNTAEPLFKRALAIQQQAFGAAHPATATTQANLAGVYSDQGLYHEAEELLKGALTTLEQTLGPQHPQVSAALNNLAALYKTQGRYPDAERLFKQALKTLSERVDPKHPLIAANSGNLAELYQIQGRYRDAEILYQRTLSTFEEVFGPNHPQVAITLGGVANLYQVQGRYSDALPLYLRALSIFEKTLGSQHPQVLLTASSLAELYRVQGNPNQAEALYKQIAQLQEGVLGPDHPELADTLSNLGALYWTQERYREAEPLYQRALAIRKHTFGPDHPLLSSSLNNIATLHQVQGRYDKARPLLERALTIDEATLGPNPPDVANTRSNLAMLGLAQGDRDLTLRHQQRALAIEETNLALNLAVGSERQKRATMNLLAASTRATVSMHLSGFPDDEAFARLALETALHRKGRVLDAVADELAALRRQLTPDQRDLLAQLAQARTELATLTLAGPASLPPKRHRDLVQTLRARTEALERSLSQASQLYQRQHKPVTLQAVAQALPDGGALVELVLYTPFNPSASAAERWGAHRFGVYVLHHDGTLRWTDLGLQKEIEAQAAALRAAILRCPLGERGFVVPDRPTGSPEACAQPQWNLPEVVKAGQALHRTLWEPVEPLLDGARHVILAPDAALNTLPFEALVNREGRFLIEERPLTYVTSGRDLLRLQAIEASTAPPVIVANPDYDMSRAAPTAGAPAGRRSVDMSLTGWGALPGTALEGRQVAHALPDATLQTQRQATEAAFKATRGPGVLHVATPGFFLTDQPQDEGNGANRGVKLSGESARSALTLAGENPLLRSGLVLAGVNQSGDGDDDGILTALELASVDLWGTQLVVFSACETGLGDVKAGQGIYGLRRSLVLAGAQSQVMSLWKVHDTATQILMARYYRQLARGEGRSEGLRTVRMEMMGEEAFRHPYFWASFVPVGLWTPVEGVTFN